MGLGRTELRMSYRNIDGQAPMVLQMVGEDEETLPVDLCVRRNIIG